MNYQELFTEGMTADTFNEVVGKLIQSETDKIRTEYSQKVRDLQEKIPAQKSEQETQLEQRLAELEAKEKRFTLAEQLQKEGLPLGLADHLSTSADVAKLKNEFQQMVLNSGFRPQNHKPTETTITREQFSKMGYSERVKLSESQPEIYQALSQNK